MIQELWSSITSMIPMVIRLMRVKSAMVILVNDGKMKLGCSTYWLDGTLQKLRLS